jgi:predicted secreted protein
MSEYAAFGTLLNKGVAQVETATAVGTIGTSGDMTAIVTAAGMTGSPITTVVAVLITDTPDTWAGKVRTALALDANITALFHVGGSGAAITLTRKIAAANDATLNIALADDTSAGITEDATSDNTRAGVALTSIAQITNIGGPGLGLDTEDVTTHDQATAWEELVATILRSGEITLDIVYDPNGATHVDLHTSMAARTIYDFSIVFPSSGTVTWNFDAYVTNFEPGAPVDGALTASVTLKISGAPALV